MPPVVSDPYTTRAHDMVAKYQTSRWRMASHADAVKKPPINACGNAVRPDENFCDELCETKFKSAQRKQQLLFLAFLAIMGLILFLPSILKMYG